jgi:hypothetical protein
MLLNILATVGIPSIISGLVFLILSRRLKRTDSTTDARKRESILILRGLYSIGGLANATAEAYKEGYANGNMTAAMEDYADYKNDLSKFLIEQNAEKK